MRTRTGKKGGEAPKLSLLLPLRELQPTPVLREEGGDDLNLLGFGRNLVLPVEEHRGGGDDG
jgi:hypothetical protein